ncbi:MAG TPA: DUF6526 family protein [Bryobacteraceae bacterium]|nr:DUF6526 family protein [Bryobacteraceae bacterium]
MAEKLPQTYANHVRLHPPFHFFLMPASLVLLILTIVNVVRYPGALQSWILLLIGMMAPVAVLLIRINPLRVQDRLIRLEERQRCQALLPEQLKSRFGELTEGQLVALRFASDAELAGLIEKTLNSKLAGKDIKKAIVTWRADTFRV